MIWNYKQDHSTLALAFTCSPVKIEEKEKSNKLSPKRKGQEIKKKGGPFLSEGGKVKQTAAGQ